MTDEGDRLKARSRLSDKIEHRRKKLALLAQGVKGMTPEAAAHARKVIEDEIAEADAVLKRMGEE